MSEFIDVLRTIKEQSSLGFKDGEECLYRGHSDSNYRLSPGVFRSEKHSFKTEESLFYEFRSKAIDAHAQALSDWDMLFYMQHYGCKTRLLDWTDNLGIALYFALCDYKLGNIPSIILLNPYALNESHTRHRDFYDPDNLDHKGGYSYRGMLLESAKDPKDPQKKGFWWKKPLAIYPIRKSDRLASQKGYFTIHGADPRPIDDQIKEEEKILTKVNIPEEVIPEAREYLMLFGINNFSIFPDMTGLSTFLNQKYNL